MDDTNTNINLNFLNGGGEMGKLIRSKDWSKTPLGSPHTWPQSLRTSVGLCMSSPFPILIAWGHETIQIYNDSYRPICGAKHPESLGQNFRICWDTALPVVGDAFTKGQNGEGTYIKDQRMFLDRFGYLEEAFMTFSFSPITDELGKVGGIFHPITETTGQMLSARRTQVLRDIAEYISDAKSNQDIYKQISNAYNEYCLDIPFLLFYKLDQNNESVSLQSAVGVSPGLSLSPETATINSQQQMWSFKEALGNMQPVVVKELGIKFGDFVCGPYPEAPHSAIVLPIQIASKEQPFGFLVAGVSSRRELNQEYTSFYILLSHTVNTAFSNIYSYEEERKRAEALLEIDKAKTVFFSNISHEFRTPLTLMLSPLEELLNQRNNNFSDLELGNIKTTQRNAIRLLKLVNTLLDYSSIESGRVQAKFSLVDIVNLTKNLASNFRSVIEKVGLKLILKVDSNIPPTYVDVQMWEKIVFNLLSNAFKYTWEGEIKVELSSEQDFIVLKVCDTGVGIPQDEIPKMFQRFHRIQSITGRTYEGTGIGLSLIKELVHMHQGTIDVQSKLNEGSVFTVKIPSGKKHINEQQLSIKAIDLDEFSSALYVNEIENLLDSGKKEVTRVGALTEKNSFPTILVVDDNADMREHISSILSSYYNVITASNGLDALNKIKESKPTLVLSDIMMPVMDGLGLLKEIKSHKGTENIPVIFLTARAGEESKIEGWETGADDYLVKPFSSKELLARIRAQINIIKLRQTLEGNVRNLFMDAPAAICVLRGPDHVFELTNEKYLELTGKKDIIGKTVREVLPELKSQGFYELLDKVYATGEPFVGNEMPIQLVKANGKLEDVFLNFVYQASHDSSGVINGILGHAVDITELVLARKKIEESEQYFRQLTDTVPAIIWITGPDGSCSYLNQNWYSYTGQTEKEALSFGWLNATHPDDKEETGRIFLEANAQRKSFMASYRLKVKNGDYRWAIDRGSPKFSEDGQYDGMIGTVVDVHEEKLASDKILDSEKQFNTLANNIQNLAWIADGEGWTYWYNQRWYDYTGTTLEEMKGWGWQKVHHPEHVNRVVDFLKQAWSINKPFELIFPLCGSDGLYRTFLTRAYPVCDTDGNIINWIGTNTDIEKQKLEEEKKDEFISIASHEMKTPLTTAKAYLQMLELSLDDNNEEANLYAKKANQSVNRLNDLIIDLLDINKISLGKLSYSLTNFNFNDMLDDTVENMQLISPTRYIIKTGKIHNVIMGDKERLQQVVINLLTNAMKYSHEKEEVYVHVEQEKDIIKVSIKDKGIGIGKGSLNKIFDKYHRIEEHSIKYQGLGIGLYISNEIIQRHQGKLWAESELGMGSIFHFTLPLVNNESVVEK